MVEEPNIRVINGLKWGNTGLNSTLHGIGKPPDSQCEMRPVLILQSGRWRECAFTMDVSHQEEEEEKDESLLRDEVTLIRQQQGR